MADSAKAVQVHALKDQQLYLGVVPVTPLSYDELEQAQLREVRSALSQFVKPYGIPIGYVQEQSGRILQHIFPKKENENQQISGSSATVLAMHTEQAFHPYRPDYVILVCLREDEAAATTYATVDDIVDRLSASDIDALLQPEFVTRVDDSFRTNGEPDEEITISILQNGAAGMEMIYDEALVSATTPRGETALEAFKAAVAQSTQEVVLRYGEALVIDNKQAIHGRKPFTARYDGTDRWLVRVLTRRELPPDEHMRGYVVTYMFGNQESHT
jgi:L-asparagine oxygenase